MKKLFQHIGELEAGSEWQLAEHGHAYHELVLVRAGELRVEIGGQEERAVSGEMFWYPKGVAHREWSAGEGPLQSRFLGLMTETWRPDWPLKIQDRQGRIAHLMQWIQQERDSGEEAAGVLREACCALVVKEVERLRRAGPPRELVRLRGWVRQRLAEALTVEDLAQQAGLSPYHFIRRYREWSGTTPMRDVRRLRIEAALDLLLTTNLRLKEIAVQVGIGDEYQLSRLIRSHTGKTATQFRKRSRG